MGLTSKSSSRSPRFHTLTSTRRPDIRKEPTIELEPSAQTRRECPVLRRVDNDEASEGQPLSSPGPVHRKTRPSNDALIFKSLAHRNPPVYGSVGRKLVTTRQCTRLCSLPGHFPLLRSFPIIYSIHKYSCFVRTCFTVSSRCVPKLGV